MHVKLNLSKRTKAILRGRSLGHYYLVCDNILQAFNAGPDLRLIDGNNWYKENKYL